ncbi:RNA polymerase sigma factor [Ruania alba]|uniref:Predicted RNA polymerase sigma factor, contains C-terminal TPR domain n=1 Tax=Ruania alba TaxID=648782 RepID=A0A1H5HGK9_9MICO|nr:DUF6596 domain-containing protein [Ruania alba]SEE26884.1 Predicted RNA polymerase sigma factor, contains C-terminal TPR domain [Ruania alba]
MTEAWEGVWRQETPHVLAALVRRHGRFSDCEDAVQEALLAAAVQWPREGMPRDPRGWLVRVASRRLVDQVRSEVSRRAREEQFAGLRMPGPASATDDPLQLMQLCCHPSLTKTSQVALMLRAVGGLTTAEIASGFLVPEATMAQRISRAKATVTRAGATFNAVEDEMRSTTAVRHAIALLYTEGHTRSSGPVITDVALTGEATGLARRLVAARPDDPENLGLLALLLLTQSRAASRADAAGELVPLEEQDRTRWDDTLIGEGVGLIERALPVGPVGEFQLQAAIAAVHAEATVWSDTDWLQIAELYRLLGVVAPSLSVTLGRAAALARVHGPEEGLAVLAELGQREAARHHRVHAVRGHLLAEAGRAEEATAALTEAARLTRSIPEQRYLHRVVDELVQ